MMRIVLFGKNGQVGWELQRILPSLGQMVALDYEDLDLADLKTLQLRLNDLKPDLIVNASAYTAVDRAESERDLAMKINGQAPGIMAEAARRSGAMLVHYSTDYVFDGRKGSPYMETDVPDPLNVYGESKLAGEIAIQQSAETYLILRTSWVYSLRGDSFVTKTLSWARKNTRLRIVSDQVSNPTWARSLAETTALLVARAGSDLLSYFRDKKGIFHLAGTGYASRLMWAQKILAADPKPHEQTAQTIEAALTSDFPTPAERPLFTALDCTCFQQTFGLHMPGWEHSLEMAME
jgi:dTDP-4-dehydrorhamnose reductase